VAARKPWGVVLAGAIPDDRPSTGSCAAAVAGVHTPIVAYPLRWLAEAGVPGATVCANSTTRTARQRTARTSGLPAQVEFHEDWMPRGAAGCVRDAGLQRDARTFMSSMAPPSRVATCGPFSKPTHVPKRPSPSAPTASRGRRRRMLRSARTASMSSIAASSTHRPARLPGHQGSADPRLHAAGVRIAGTSARALAPASTTPGAICRSTVGRSPGSRSTASCRRATPAATKPSCTRAPVSRRRPA
jgi:hypothetical protein